MNTVSECASPNFGDQCGTTPSKNFNRLLSMNGGSLLMIPWMELSVVAQADICGALRGRCSIGPQAASIRVP